MLACEPSSFGVGDEGRVTVGVESVVPLVAVFFAFFLRPTMGACSGFAASTARGASWFFEGPSTVLARACLSFFCWLFDICLTGAEPTLVGGGVFAREIEAEVSDALSEILSLIGVPGSCIDAKLPLREGCLFEAAGGGKLAFKGEADGKGGGASATGVARTRIVRDCVERGTEAPVACDTTAVGVAGVTGRGSTGAADDEISFGFFCTDEVVSEFVFSLEASLAAEISSFAGNCGVGAVAEAFCSCLG